MNCPNCKKDLVFGTDCDQCRAILAPVVAPIEETRVKKVVRKIKKIIKRKKK